MPCSHPTNYFLSWCTWPHRCSPRLSGIQWILQSKVMPWLQMNSLGHMMYSWVYRRRYDQQKTSYILQFLWRDLTSKFDVIGPYFTCAGSWDHKFLLECVMRTIQAFTLYNFRIRVIVCDGESSNLALLNCCVAMNMSSCHWVMVMTHLQSRHHLKTRMSVMSSGQESVCCNLPVSPGNLSYYN